MYKAFNETRGTERNKIQVYLIKNRLTVLKKDITNTSKKDGHKIEKKWMLLKRFFTLMMMKIKIKKDKD